ncbi:hypothetical protein FHS82_002720 [Pseudochelatococcus lubricantis]|uniref:Uncharacterized protein n=1 Tax=Pseudochelatococcus lubricantis TaxID=1538102 RepID=A0ABX0V3D3_9HYPH|nr:hypothetical protein [Pseudochelatococcus lubricantis]
MLAKLIITFVAQAVIFSLPKITRFRNCFSHFIPQ